MPLSNLRPCKVLIAGGGISGLTLALSLEKHGVDYLLLEAYPDLAPRRGGGILVMPNGARILDQLGCYEDLYQRAGGSGVSRLYLRGPDGQVLATVDHTDKDLTERHGYPNIWVDRHHLLRTLHDHIADKSRILPNKRITTVHHLPDGVEITTADGSTYRGDILVGADGTHSTVRQAIVSRATALGLGKEYSEEEQIPSTYDCIFGLSSYHPGLAQEGEESTLQFILGDHQSYIVGTSGPTNRSWWFLFLNRGAIHHGAEIPKYDAADKARVLRAHASDQLTPTVTLADLMSAGPAETVYTPLREWVYSRWHLGRMGVVGDAAHKMTTVLGQGGNQAIESVAALTNSLVKGLANGGTGRMTGDEIEAMFEEMQVLRAPRARDMMEASGKKQRADAMETPELKHFSMHVFPKIIALGTFRRWKQYLAGAVSLRGLPIPYRKRVVPFDDEVERATEGLGRVEAKL
ncbi:FAD/NAD(P)-binding domain-containing protein [Aspergillus uvarum CBS 121591]|uniref:FAD/NAD(P)-binding domain-containing protein n=1 Tax=Aspergillus uvarum CBS 121591 TaxID=1448315 RepID=A0A319DE23_9EURO|nr:FAD/NAD(P)-binding domain-containing protein [Aspergillus uvarum CBS 121591]PYH86338.1 FAD/NAD(P)-binding domain-containing protein [Aspergillus uvarum CBS 121591]